VDRSGRAIKIEAVDRRSSEGRAARMTARRLAAILAADVVGYNGLMRV